MTLGSIKPKMSCCKQHAISAAISAELICYELELMEESDIPLQCYHSMQYPQRKLLIRC